MDGFQTNPNEIKKYGAELAKLVAALVENCDIVGLTEIHPFWYNWLTVDYGLSFAAGREFESAYDKDSCAIIYDKGQFARTGHIHVTKSFLPEEITDHAEAARFDSSQYMAIELTTLAPPQVAFTAAIAYSIRGSTCLLYTSDAADE